MSAFAARINVTEIEEIRPKMKVTSTLIPSLLGPGFDVMTASSPENNPGPPPR